MMAVIGCAPGVLRCIALYCIVLYCVVLHYPALYLELKCLSIGHVRTTVNTTNAGQRYLTVVPYAHNTQHTAHTTHTTHTTQHTTINSSTNGYFKSKLANIFNCNISIQHPQHYNTDSHQLFIFSKFYSHCRSIESIE